MLNTPSPRIFNLVGSMSLVCWLMATAYTQSSTHFWLHEVPTLMFPKSRRFLGESLRNSLRNQQNMAEPSTVVKANRAVICVCAHHRQSSVLGRSSADVPSSSTGQDGGSSTKKSRWSKFLYQQVLHEVPGGPDPIHNRNQRRRPEVYVYSSTIHF